MPHRRGQPAVKELECQCQVGPVAVVDAAPLGGEVPQFPQRPGVAGPATGEGVGAALAVVRDQDLGDPALEAGQLACAVGRVEVVPPGGGRPIGGGGVEGVGDGLGDFFEPAVQFVQPAAQLVHASLVETAPGGVELAAEVGDLLGERTERPGQPRQGGRVVGRRVRR